MKKTIFHSNIKRCLFLSCLFICLTGCGESSTSDEYKQIIYTEEPEYDYELFDDDRYGKAIYPNEAYRILREIKAHNRQEGIDWPEAGYYVESSDTISLIGNLPVSGTKNKEIYLKDEYYNLYNATISNTDGSPILNAYNDSFYYEEETFYHKRSVYEDNTQEPPYIEESSISQMEGFKLMNSIIGDQYDNFLSIVKSIEDEQLKSVINPQQIKCFVKVDEHDEQIPGYLTININRQHTLANGKPYRMIYRIVFEDYMPVMAVNNKVTSILINSDYRSELKMTKFIYDVEEIRGEI